VIEGGGILPCWSWESDLVMEEEEGKWLLIKEG